jgi:hypothetical protein
MIAFASAFGGCNPGAAPTQGRTDAVTRDALLGKWQLVSVGGELPAALSIKAHQLELRGDGAWVAFSELQGSFAGMKLNPSGTWSWANGAVSYTAGGNSGTAMVRLVSGRLVLDPDFVLRKEGTVAVAAEYQRGELGER